MASFSAKDISHVVKFNGSNFPLWKFQVCLTLNQHDLMDIVEGKAKLPQTQVDAIGAVTNEAAIKKWKSEDNSAQCLIAATVEQSHLRTLMNCKSAESMLTRLITQYEQAAADNKYFLQQCFFEYKFQSSHDICTHITTIESMANQLKDLGVVVDDMQIITKVICTLPPSFRHIVSVWDNFEDSKKTLQLLTARLLKEETRNKSYKESPRKEKPLGRPVLEEEEVDKSKPIAS